MACANALGAKSGAMAIDKLDRYTFYTPCPLASRQRGEVVDGPEVALTFGAVLNFWAARQRNQPCIECVNCVSSPRSPPGPGEDEAAPWCSSALGPFSRSEPNARHIVTLVFGPAGLEQP
jgi:hypothetical protein